MRKRPFCTILTKDRLGTNTGKTHKERQRLLTGQACGGRDGFETIFRHHFGMPPGHEDVLGEDGDANRLESATLQGGLLGQYILRSTLVQLPVRFKLSGRSILRAHLNISTAQSERKRFGHKLSKRVLKPFLRFSS